MHSFGVKWITAIALAIALAGCATTAPAGNEATASPSKPLVTMAESGQCAEVQSRVDVLFTTYDQWLGPLENLASSYGESESDLRRYLQTNSKLIDVPRDLWTSAETGSAAGIELRTADLREELWKSVFIGVPPLVPEQASAKRLVDARWANALTAASPQTPSGTPFLQALGVLDTFPLYGNVLKDFMTSYCPVT
jgi:hypothetical protein